MKPVFVTRALGAADADGISLAQQTAGAGNLLINGAFASGGVATLDVQRVVGIASAGNLSAITFTVYGTNSEGLAISEAIAGPNANTVSTTANFKTVTRVAVSGVVGFDVTVGTTAVGSSQWIALDQHVDFGVALFVEISGTANVTVQYTASDVFAPGALSPTAIVAVDHPNLTSKATNADSNIAYPAAAVRVKTNSGDGTVKFIVRQSGLGT